MRGVAQNEELLYRGASSARELCIRSGHALESARQVAGCVHIFFFCVCRVSSPVIELTPFHRFLPSPRLAGVTTAAEPRRVDLDYCGVQQLAVADCAQLGEGTFFLFAISRPFLPAVPL